MNRRNFVKGVGLGVGSIVVGSPLSYGSQRYWQKKITIEGVNSNFEREPLVRPFGFKGGSITNIWQVVSLLRSSGHEGLGVGTQNVLWSDAAVFAAHSEAAGNALMYAVTERSMQLANGRSFSNPIELQEEILADVFEYAKGVTSNPNLRKTFALNAMVPLDNAAWMLFARENGLTNFDQLVPERYAPALAYKHKKVASIPVVGYNIPMKDIVKAVDDGYFLLKIKIGQPGTQEEMVQKDMARLTAIHEAIGGKTTPHTKDGKLPYYFDANGRYQKKETLLRFIDHAKKIGAYDQIAVIEEPFAEHLDIDVSDVPARLAADESAHTDKDALERIQMGYRAIALKAVAKTMSMTMKIAQVAHDNDVPCFCADLTVNPVLLDWNKTVAARIGAFPGLEDMGLMETNGHQNYLHWEKMRSYLPDANASWTQPKDGVFPLDDDYYEQSGGILMPSSHYMGLAGS